MSPLYNPTNDQRGRLPPSTAIGSKTDRGRKTKNCEICGTKFESFNPNPRFCSIQCKAISQTATIDLIMAIELYENGLTQDEIAAALNVSQKVIYNAFRRNGFKCRIACKRNQTGENNDSRKGDQATYAAFHHRVEVARGKPRKCDVCGRSDDGVMYDWAILSTKITISQSPLPLRPYSLTNKQRQR